MWDGVTLIRCGGHFPGGTVLHWAQGAGGRGVVCAGDILTVATDRKWLSFMRSYPNFIPLSAKEVEHIGAAMAPFSFDVLYGHYFDRVIAKDAKPVLEKSVARYIAAINGTRYRKNKTGRLPEGGDARGRMRCAPRVAGRTQQLR